MSDWVACAACVGVCVGVAVCVGGCVSVCVCVSVCAHVCEEWPEASAPCLVVVTPLGALVLSPASALQMFSSIFLSHYIFLGDGPQPLKLIAGEQRRRKRRMCHLIDLMSTVWRLQQSIIYNREREIHALERRGCFAVIPAVLTLDVLFKSHSVFSPQLQCLFWSPHTCCATVT